MIDSLITLIFSFINLILSNDVHIKFPSILVVGNPSTECLAKSDDVLELITGSSEGGCAIPFQRLKLPITKSLSNQVLEFDMEFLVTPNDDVGRCGGIYYGNHHLDRSTSGNTVMYWIDRAGDRGYRFYESGPAPSHDSIGLLPRKKDPARHLRIIIKSNGEQILVADNDIWRNLSGNAVQFVNKPFLGFRA
ncbi:unnamed protein product [Rotaria sordida]|uniref:Uncharacterized protein n=1 Tax=Rotaria sordida TaxID=392033 RepID=A0A813QGW0_9BILA|nr:unnamed protein product [Rotaria sordida]CAF4029682.1 unnamed protein product [Rotaria sordida]CAF4250610.1 unnamed protein product [Rotaria sordida]